MGGFLPLPVFLFCICDLDKKNGKINTQEQMASSMAVHGLNKTQLDINVHFILNHGMLKYCFDYYLKDQTCLIWRQMVAAAAEN